MHAVAVDGHLDADRDQPLAGDRVHVDVVLGLPHAVGQPGDALAGQRLHVVLHLGEGGLDHVDAVLVAEPADLPLRDVAGLGLGLEVADDVGRGAGVVGDQLRHVGEVLALAVDPDRRDAEPLGHVVERAHVEGARHRAADIGPVAVGLGEAQVDALVENGADDARVVEVGAALVDVVHDEGIAGVDVVAELVDDGLGGVVQRAHVGGDVARALHDGVAFGVADCRGKIPRPDHEGVAGAEDLLRHLVDDVDVGVLEHLEGHGVERVAFSVLAHCLFLALCVSLRPAGCA